MLTPAEAAMTPREYLEGCYSRVVLLSLTSLRRLRRNVEAFEAAGGLRPMGELTAADVNQFPLRVKGQRKQFEAMFRHAGTLQPLPADALHEFAKAFMADQGAGSGLKLFSALKYFGQFLTRTPTAKDLEDGLLSRFGAWCRSRKYSERCVTSHLRQLALLWTWLAKRKIVEASPAEALALPESQPVIQGPSPLADYFRLHYARQKELTKQTFKSVLSVARQFDEFTGRKSLARIRPAMVEQFADQLRKSRLRPSVIQKNRGFVIAILRHAGYWPEAEQPAVKASGELWQVCHAEYFPRKTEIRSELTRHQYGVALRSFGKFLGRDPSLSDLNDEAVAAWLADQVAAGKSINTAREQVGRILALWTWLARQRRIEAFPAVEKPSPPESVAKPLSDSQLRALFATAADQRGAICGLPADLWWMSFFAMALTTGERKSALLACQVGWIDLANSRATFPPEVRQGRRQRGEYRLWPEMAVLLKRMIEVDPARRLVWPWGLSASSYHTALNSIVKAAGIPGTREFKTDALRVSQAAAERQYLEQRMMPGEISRRFVPWLTGGAT